MLLLIKFTDYMTNNKTIVENILDLVLALIIWKKNLFIATNFRRKITSSNSKINIIISLFSEPRKPNECNEFGDLVMLK